MPQFTKIQRNICLCTEQIRCLMHCIVRGSKGLVLFQCQYLDPVLYTSEARALNRAPIVDHAIAHFLVPYLDNKILNMERLSFDQPPPFSLSHTQCGNYGQAE